MQNQLGLYIHIPFCVKKCDYCDFLSFGGTSQASKDLYIEGLCQELLVLAKSFEGKSLRTVYIGGGTPSVLSKANFIKLMTCLKGAFVIEAGAEITMEMNPGTVNEEDMQVYMSMGINRVSMGLQSDDDGQLETLGRIHTFNQYLETYKMMRRMGITNINVDVMFGLSGQSLDQWAGTLASVVALEPEHIAAYSLIIEADTVYEERFEEGSLSLPDEDVERQMFWLTHDYLEQAGYHQYEISNYAKEGYESKHNSSYWDLTPYIGAGLGASSYYDGCRYKNITDMNAYIEAQGDLGVIRQLEQEPSKQAALEESFFLGLRCMKGVDLKVLERTYGGRALKPFDEVIKTLLTEGLLKMEGGHVALTKRGIDISNQVMSRFIL